MSKYVPKEFAPRIYSAWSRIFQTMTERERSEVLLAIATYPNYEPTDVPLWPFLKGEIDRQHQTFAELCQKQSDRRKGKGETADDRGQPRSTTDDHGQPPSTINKNKEEGIRNKEDGIDMSLPSAEPSACVSKPKKKKTNVQKPEDVEQADWDAYLRIRKQKNLPLTDRALNLLRNEGKKAGITLQQVIVKCLEKGWAGFEAEWVAGQKQTQPPKKNIFLVNHKEEPPEEKEIVPSRDEDEWNKAQPYVKEALAKYGC